MSKKIMQQSLNALKYHQEQTRPIHNTIETIAALEAELAKGEQPQADLRKAAELAFDLLCDAVEPTATQIQSDIGMCAQWDVDAIECIDALRQALAQPEQNFCPRCGKRLGDGIHTCTPPAQIALDKKADNARELGLDYEPVLVMELTEDGWGIIPDDDFMETLPNGTKLYTAPPKRECQHCGKITKP